MKTKTIVKEMTDEELFEKIRRDERGIIAKAKDGLKRCKHIREDKELYNQLMKSLDSIKHGKITAWKD